MSERAALFTKALKLIGNRTCKLADELYESVDDVSPDIDSMSEKELERELNRRHEEFLRRSSVGVTLDEVKRITRIE